MKSNRASWKAALCLHPQRNLKYWKPIERHARIAVEGESIMRAIGGTTCRRLWQLCQVVTEILDSRGEHPSKILQRITG